jgi:nucleoside triphosphatase
MGTIRTRVIAVPILTDAGGRVLLCRMSAGRGVFPGQWALPGGGIEPGERIDDALRREVREELSVELASWEPLLFKDDVLDKQFADGSRQPLHMIFLVYRCTPASNEIVLNEEFSEYGWFRRDELEALPLNPLTRATLSQGGYIGNPQGI